jgi:hypothetical protein
VRMIGPFPRYSSIISIPSGGLWEGSLDLAYDYLLVEDGVRTRPPCPHCIFVGIFHFSPSVHDAVYAQSFYLCPHVITAYNEGGHATTGTCLDCVRSINPLSINP